MTKERAIKELELIAKVTMRNARKEAMEMAIKALEQEPIKHGEWIPCSKRLPSESGRYLVAYHLLISKDKWVDIMYFGKPSMPNKKVKGKCWYRADNEWGDVVYDNILAWMPLPESYKGGGE